MPGDFIFGDNDGVQVIPQDLVDEVLLRVEDTFAKENEEREALAAGMPIDEVYRAVWRALATGGEESHGQVRAECCPPYPTPMWKLGQQMGVTTRSPECRRTSPGPVQAGLHVVSPHEAAFADAGYTIAGIESRPADAEDDHRGCPAATRNIDTIERDAGQHGRGRHPDVVLGWMAG